MPNNQPRSARRKTPGNPRTPLPAEKLTRARPGEGKRRETSCVGCGKRTTAKDATCRTCRVDGNGEVFRRGLEGGRWMPVRGVMRWVPDRAAQQDKDVA